MKLKVLIIRPSALGDTLMLMPAIAQLRLSTEMILIGRSPGIDIVKPYVGACIDFEGPGWHKLFLENIEGAHALPIPTVHKIVAFLGDPDGRVNNNLMGIMPTASVHIFPAFPSRDEKIHVALYLAQCLQKAGLAIDPGKSIKEACIGPLFENGDQSTDKGGVIFHPGSGGRNKNFPPDLWLELSKRMGEHYPDERFIFLFGPAEEYSYAFFKKCLSNEEVEIIFSPEREKLLSLLKHAPLYIGHDSGITHLSAMTGTPTIALFKNSPVNQWRPLGPAVVVIENGGDRFGLMMEILQETKGFL